MEGKITKLNETDEKALESARYYDTLQEGNVKRTRAKVKEKRRDPRWSKTRYGRTNRGKEEEIDEMNVGSESYYDKLYEDAKRKGEKS